MDVEKLIAVAVKLGYLEQRDKNGKLIMFTEEAKARQDSLAGNMVKSQPFKHFINNVSS